VTFSAIPKWIFKTHNLYRSPSGVITTVGFRV
jgi:hypothetical protein